MKAKEKAQKGAGHWQTAKRSSPGKRHRRKEKEFNSPLEGVTSLQMSLTKKRSTRKPKRSDKGHDYKDLGMPFSLGRVRSNYQ